MEENGAEACSVELGGAWHICEVKSAPEKLKTKVVEKLQVKNAFKEICDSDDDDDEKLFDEDDYPGFKEIEVVESKDKFERMSEKVSQKLKKSVAIERKKKEGDDFEKMLSEVVIAAVENNNTQLGLGFQVTNVKKPLLSAKRVCEKGNIVQFGPKPTDSFIANVSTGQRLMLRQKGKSWILDVRFKDGTWREITVDSAAEESVCPEDWGKEVYGLIPIEKGKEMQFVGANGSKICHYGQREVMVEAATTFPWQG